jgi:hypothetical protein
MPFGGAVGEGFVSPAVFRITVEDLVPGDGFFLYSPTKAFGNLVSSDTVQAGTDSVGNAFLAGNTTYQIGSTCFATSLNGGFINFYTATGAGGPWTFQGNILISTVGPTLVFNFPQLGGAITIPQPAIAVSMPLTLPAPAAYSQLYAGLQSAAINDIYAGLQSANVFA